MKGLSGTALSAKKGADRIASKFPRAGRSLVHRPRTNASSKENLEELDDPYQSY